MADLSQLEVFVAVVDSGSFTAAAEALGVSKSFASRQVSQLEDRLGARLLQRTTRKVSLTDVGRVFHERCARILEDLQEAELAVSQMQTVPRGTLRMSVPMSFGLRYVAPAVGELMARYADLHVDVSFSDHRADLMDEALDVVIRIGKLADSSFIGRKLAPARTFVCASPDYLKARGTPRAPEDLRDHDCLLYAYQRTGHAWSLEGPQGEVSVPVAGRMVANNGDALLEAARRGLGVVYAPDFLAADDLRAGRLSRVLPEWCSEAAVWAIYPHNRHLSAKVRAFVDLLGAHFENPPWANCCREES